jgi:hypothetical protein
MKKLLIVLILLTGCNKFRSLYSSEHTDPHHDPLPATYTISGITVQDYQLIQPIRVENSNIEIRIKTETGYRTLNPYEVIVSTGNSLGGWIRFQNRVDLAPPFTLILTGKPVAPIGTYYEITSTLVGS